MFGKKVFAAMLATVLGASLFGANAAKAQLNLDENEGAVSYATETLVATVDGFDDYSVVRSTSALNVTAPIGLGGPMGTYVTVKFVLSGMVFSAPVMGSHLVIATGSYATPSSLRSGGKVGDDNVSFIVNRSGSTASGTDVATLTIGQLGVKPSVVGSVMMTVTDSVGDDEEYTASYTNAVRTTRALQETPMPVNLVATVEERFKSFRAADGTATTMGTLGSFMIGANTALLDALEGNMVVLEEDIIDPGETSSVTISGDFSFASMAWLQATAACSTEGATDLRQMDDDGNVLDELVPQPLTADTLGLFEAAEGQHLCISAHTGEEAVAIPATAPYIVTTEYDAGTPMAGWPPNAGEYSLGRITRDGTTVHIPYLTTWADYNQRIVVSNRGANSAPYWITFRPEEGVTATPNDMYAMGTLDGGSTIVLRVMDVVTLEGRTRTAATFVAEAPATQIDVATVIVNMMTGSTDTVNYEPEPTE